MSRRDIIAIGGSMGAVEAVRRLCRELPPDLAATLFIVLHVGARGHNLLAGIFQEEARIGISTAEEGETIRPGHAYIAPVDRHLLVIDDAIRLGRGPRENMSRPAIDPLFRSVASCCGPRAIGVILTGNLNDGASGLAAVKRCGGTTVVQNPSDSLAPDMPWEALHSTDVDYRAPMAEMAGLLVKLTLEEAGPRCEADADLKSEVQIALGRSSDLGAPSVRSELTALICPGCGGVLSQIKSSSPLRFRCQVGHAYTAESLANQKENAIDEAMRIALRILEEQVTLCAKMADDARSSGRGAAASSFEQRLMESLAQANLLRRAIEEL